MNSVRLAFKSVGNAFKNNSVRDAAICIYVFISIFVRYLCYGFTYFHQLDDYIQYWGYAGSPDRWAVVMLEGLLTSRPLAGLCDLYVWGAFFDNMIIAVMLISILYAVSAVLFLKVFRKYFNTGFMFVVFYSLMPFFFEGVYWVSASSRIVVGLFFTALSVWLLQKYFDAKKWKWILLIPFWLVQLISVSFYEQIFILSMVLNFVIVMLNIHGKKDFKKVFLLLILFANVIIYFGFTGIFANINSALSNRMVIERPRLSESYFMFLLDWLTQMKICFWDVPVSVTFTGFVRGLKMIFTDGLWFTVPVIALLAGSSFVLCKTDTNYDIPSKKKLRTVLIGIFLAFMPVSLFFLISNPYFCMRNIPPSFVGIALIADMVFGYLARRKKLVMQCVSAGIAALFFVSSISETHDYKAVYDFDMKICTNILKTMEENPYDGATAFLIQGGDKGTVNIRYHEHASGVISSQWATLGMLTYLNEDNNPNNGNAMPIETENGIYHYGWEKNVKLITNFGKIYYWDNNSSQFIELYINVVNDSIVELLNAQGGCVATLKEHNNIGYILYN